MGCISLEMQIKIKQNMQNTLDMKATIQSQKRSIITPDIQNRFFPKLCLNKQILKTNITQRPNIKLFCYKEGK